MPLTTPIKQAGDEIRTTSEAVRATTRDRVVEPVRSKVNDTDTERVTRRLPLIAAAGAAVVGAYAIVKRSLNGRADESGNGHRPPVKSGGPELRSK